VSSVLVVISSIALSAPPEKPKPTLKKGLAAPSYLSPLARQLLKKRMARHGRDMVNLVQSVLFLDRETTRRLAAEMAAEPRLTRPIAGGENDLNSALPMRFFVLQDELRSRALALGEAALTAKTVDLATRLGELTQTCVSCHSTYLEPESQSP
jgi:hypothetical protein